MLSGVGSILIFYIILSENVRKRNALLFTAIFSLCGSYIRYSTELKQYMSDIFFCLLTLYLWQRYRDKKLSIVPLVICYAIIVWFSFSAVFFIAACMILLFMSFLKQFVKEHKIESFKNLCMCLIVLASFILYYIFWLSTTSTNVGENGYWDLIRFPLSLKALSDVGMLYTMAKQFIIFYPKILSIFIYILSAAYIFIVINRGDKSKVFLPFCVSLIFMLIASSMGFYPMEGRLLQPFCMVFIIISCIAFDEIETVFLMDEDTAKYSLSLRKFLIWLINLVLMVCLVINVKSGLSGMTKKYIQIYYGGGDLRAYNAILKENMKDTDYLYINANILPSYLYVDNYPIILDSYDNLPFEKDNVIYGQRYRRFLYKEPYSYEYEDMHSAIKDDAAIISSHSSVYILMGGMDREMKKLMEILENTGKVEMVEDKNGACLYLYTKNK